MPDALDRASHVDPETERAAPKEPTWEKGVLAVYLVAAGVLLMYLIVRLWPDALPGGKWNPDVYVFWKQGPTTVPDEMRLLLLVFAAGGLGSFIHAATSFVDFVGNRRFVRSWTLWYVLRPVIGSALATVLYVAVRGGLLTAASAGQNVSPFGVCAIAALAGMFSKQATDKLNEMFTTLFKTSADGDAARKDKLDSAPRVTGVTPSLLHRATDTDITVNGSGFDPAAVARLNGQARQTTFLSVSQLTVKLTAADLNGNTPLTLVIHNPNGQTSAPVTLTVS